MKLHREALCSTLCLVLASSIALILLHGCAMYCSAYLHIPSIKLINYCHIAGCSYNKGLFSGKCAWTEGYLARDGKATHLITGDKDLLDINIFEKTKIVTIVDY